MSASINSNSSSITTSNSIFSELESMIQETNEVSLDMAEKIDRCVDIYNKMVESVLLSSRVLEDNSKNLEMKMKYKQFLEKRLKFLSSFFPAEQGNPVIEITLPTSKVNSIPSKITRKQPAPQNESIPPLIIRSNFPEPINSLQESGSSLPKKAVSSPISSSNNGNSLSSNTLFSPSKKAKTVRASSSDNGNSSSSTSSSSSSKKAKVTHVISSTDASLSEEEVILKTFRTGDAFLYKKEKLTFESYSKEEGLKLRDKNGQTVSVEDVSQVIYCPTPGLRFLAKLNPKDEKYYVATVAEDCEQTTTRSNKAPCLKIKNVSWECGGSPSAEKYGYDLKSFIPVHQQNFLNTLPSENVTLKRTENGTITKTAAKVYSLFPRSK